MATQTISDLSGAVVEDEDVTAFLVLAHPKITEPKRLDVSKTEADALTPNPKPDVHVRVKINGKDEDLTMTEAAFAKLFKGKDIDTLFGKASPVKDAPAAPSRSRAAKKTTATKGAGSSYAGRKDIGDARKWAREQNLIPKDGAARRLPDDVWEKYDARSK